MLDHDWAVAIEQSNRRNREFPLFKCRACKVFETLKEDEETELIIYVSDIIEEYLRGSARENINGFHRNQIMTFLIARLGRFTLTWFMEEFTYFTLYNNRPFSNLQQLNIFLSH